MSTHRAYCRYHYGDKQYTQDCRTLYQLPQRYGAAGLSLLMLSFGLLHEMITVLMSDRSFVLLPDLTQGDTLTAALLLLSSVSGFISVFHSTVATTHLQKEHPNFEVALRRQAAQQVEMLMSESTSLFARGWKHLFLWGGFFASANVTLLLACVALSSSLTMTGVFALSMLSLNMLLMSWFAYQQLSHYYKMTMSDELKILLLPAGSEGEKKFPRVYFSDDFPDQKVNFSKETLDEHIRSIGQPQKGKTRTPGEM